MSQFNIQIPDELHKKFKSASYKHETSMTKLTIQLIKEFLEKETQKNIIK